MIPLSEWAAGQDSRAGYVATAITRPRVPACLPKRAGRYCRASKESVAMSPKDSFDSFIQTIRYALMCMRWRTCSTVQPCLLCVMCDAAQMQLLILHACFTMLWAHTPTAQEAYI